MKSISLLSLTIFFLFGITSCKKVIGPQGGEGLKSLIDIKNVPSTSSCPPGGIVIKTGIDKNQNNVLDSVEVANTNYICNGQNGQDGQDGGYDKQIRLKMAFPSFYANTGSITPVVAGELTKFSKLNYTKVDSIIFVANPSVNNPLDTVTLQLYNITDNVVIANSTLTSTSPWNLARYAQTGNLYKELPDKEITLGITIKSSIERAVTSGDCYIFLYRK